MLHVKEEEGRYLMNTCDHGRSFFHLFIVIMDGSLGI